MSLFLANSAPFGVSLTMAVNCVVEKETALGCISSAVASKFLTLDVCVYIKITSS